MSHSRFSVICAVIFSVLFSSSILPAAGNFQVSDWNIENQKANNQADFSVVFTEPLVPKSDANYKLKGNPGEFSPAISGIWFLKSANTFCFVPLQSWAPCTNYTVNLNSSIVSLTGQKLTGQTSYKFTNNPLRLISCDTVGNTLDKLSLKFSGYVVPADLKKFLTFTNDKGKSLDWEPLQSVSSQIVTLKFSTPFDSPVIFWQIEKGLMPAQGDAGVESMQKGKVNLAEPLSIDYIKPKITKDGKKFLVLNTSLSCSSELNDFKSHISVVPHVDFSVEQDYSRIRLSGDFQYETPYTVTVTPGLVAKSGKFQSLLASTETLKITFPTQPVSLQILSDNGWMSTKGTMKIPVLAQRITKPVQVTVYRVFNNNYPLFLKSSETPENVVTWGDKVLETTVTVTKDYAEIDLRKLLGNNSSGTYALRVSAENTSTDYGAEYGSDDSDYSFEQSGQYGQTLKDFKIISLTNLGLLSKSGKDRVTVWACELNTAKPKPDVSVELYSKANQKVGEGKTDKQGLIHFTGLPTRGQLLPKYVLAKDGEDLTYLKLSSNEGYVLSDASNCNVDFVPEGGYRAYVTPDRGAYRPGETAHILALLRDRNGNAPKVNIPVTIKLTSPFGQSTFEQTRTTDIEGRLEIPLVLPDDQPTGEYSVELSVPGTPGRDPFIRRSSDLDSHDDGEDEKDYETDSGKLGSASIFIGEFQPNRLRVSVNVPQTHLPAPAPFIASVKAEELFGSLATGRQVNANVEFSWEDFAPKEFNMFKFGDNSSADRNIREELGETTIDATGHASFTVTPPKWSPTGPLLAKIQANVLDSGRAVTGISNVLVDTNPFYIGLKKAAEGFAKLGEDTTFEIIAVSSGDNAKLFTFDKEIPLSVTLCKKQWNNTLSKYSRYLGYESKLEYIPVTSGTVVMGKDGRASWSFKPVSSGDYELRVSTTDIAVDKKGTIHEKIMTSLSFYASSGDWDSNQSWSMDKPQNVQVALDRTAYNPGDTAKILIKSPFPGTAVIGLEQNMPLNVIVAEMKTNTLEIPITVQDNFMPQVYVTVSVLRPVTPEANWLPHRATGSASLKLAPEPHKIGVTITTPASATPGDKLTVQAKLTDPGTSAPITGANVQLWAVDEGILNLTQFKLLNPMDWLFQDYRLGVITADFYSNLIADFPDNARNPNTQGGDGGDTSLRFTSHMGKKRIKPVALWLGNSKSDSSGTVEGQFQLPSDFNGSMIVMALADNSTKMGAGIQQIPVRAPLIVQNNAPRFLATGDSANMTYTLFNTTDTPAKAALEFVTSGPLSIDSTDTQSLTQIEIPAQGSQIVTIKLLAKTNQIGEAGILCKGTLNGYTATDNVEIPVRAPSPSISWSGIRQIPNDNSSIDINLCPLNNAIPETLSVKITAGSFAPIQLQNALDANLNYPYGCLEQTVSKALPLLSVEQAGLAGALGYSRDYLRKQVQNGINRVPLYRAPYGDFLTMWTGNNEDSARNPFVTAYALILLCEGRDAGYDVPAGLINMMGRSMINSVDDNSVDIQAFMYYASVRAGFPDRRIRTKLLNDRDVMSPSGLGWFACALNLEGQKPLMNETLTSAVACMASEQSREPDKDDFSFGSDDRHRAVVLWSLLNTLEPNQSIPIEALSIAQKIVKASRNNTWGNTQANAWSIMALAALAKANTQPEPINFHGVITCEKNEVGTFTQTQPLCLTTTTPLITIKSTGNGTSAVSWTGSAIPMNPLPASSSGGLAMTRRLLDRNGTPINYNNIKLGQLLVVELAFKTTSDLNNLVVQDLLPAGFEVEDTRLVTSEKVSSSLVESNDNNWSTQRVDPRDDRMLVFGRCNTTDKDKIAIFRYSVRATTSGTFIMPPTQVEHMYNPNIMSRTDKSQITIR